MISIVIPVYNASNTLEKAVESVERQTQADWELLLIDDGSTDGSTNICDSLAERDHRIRVFHKANGGVSSARNIGIAEAQGEYLLFLDSDDTLPIDALQMLSQSQADVVLGSVLFCRTDGSKMEEVLPQLTLNEDNMGDFYQNHLTHTCLSAVWAKLFRADLVRDNKVRFYETLRTGEDLCFLIDCLACAVHVDVLPHVVYVYNCFEGGKYKLSPQEYINRIQLVEHSLARLQQRCVFDTSVFVSQKTEPPLRCLLNWGMAQGVTWHTIRDFSMAISKTRKSIALISLCGRRKPYKFTLWLLQHGAASLAYLMVTLVFKNKLF